MLKHGIAVRQQLQENPEFININVVDSTLKLKHDPASKYNHVSPNLQTHTSSPR